MDSDFGLHHANFIKEFRRLVGWGDSQNESAPIRIDIVGIIVMASPDSADGVPAEAGFQQ